MATPRQIPRPTIRRRTVPALLILLLCQFGAAEAAGTECMFEFNKAYSWNEGGEEQLELARQHTARREIQAARERYQQAIALLQKSIDHYEQLPDLAFDCSPTNLSIARNNIRIARENLELARDSLAGLDCAKALDELESLTNLASEYYYEHDDPRSARQSAQDAVGLADSIAEQGICTGTHREALAEQTRYARKVANSLRKRSGYDRCIQLLDRARRSQEQAGRADPERDAGAARQAWRRALDDAQEAVDSGACEDAYRDSAVDLRRRARQRLNHLEAP